MKKLFITLVCAAAVGTLHAQVENPGDAAKSGATDHVNNNISNTVDNSIDKTEGAIKSLFKKKKKPAPTDPNSQNQPAAATAQGAGNSAVNIKDYKNYDFTPGDKIIFESQLTDERIGEIPAQFTLAEGQMDTQTEDGENVVHVPKGAGATMAPRMTSATYLPDQFTVEFDFKNERFGINHINVNFGEGDAAIKSISFSYGSLDWTLGDVDFPSGLNASDEYPMKWHHVAIAVNKNAGKVYIDQYRVANVNNITGKASSLSFEVNGYENSYIKNIRVASGGIDIYKKITTDSKIITHGILFDIDKAAIRPESMGTINGIYNLLKGDASLKFEIGGHTDNSGTAPHNLTLSQQRADAVKAQLVAMGIDASRLTTKGFGDTQPMANNTTPEGKANNRRVVFTKI